MTQPKRFNVVTQWHVLPRFDDLEYWDRNFGHYKDESGTFVVPIRSDYTIDDDAGECICESVARGMRHLFNSGAKTVALVSVRGNDEDGNAVQFWKDD